MLPNAMIPRGIRSNNPGNIRKSSVPWTGKVVGTDPDFETFDTPRNGIRATAENLLAYYDRHGLKTVRGIINRWAPPVENDTSAYVAIVAQALGVGQDTIINVHSPAVLRALVTAIIQHENGQQPYASNLIGAAIGDALGIIVKDGASTDSGQPPIVDEAGSLNVRPPSFNEPRKRMEPRDIFGTIIAQLIPQVSKILLGGTPYAALADTVLQTVVAATGATNEQEAVSKMQSDPAMLKAATAAVVADPKIFEALVEVGGGIGGAREANAAYTASLEDDDWWRIVAKFLFNPVHWVTGVFLFYVQQFVPALAGRVQALSPEAVISLIMIIFTVLTLVGAYWLGTYIQKQKGDQ